MSLTGELYRLQETHGYLKDTDLRDLARRLHVPLHRLQGLASFYPHFRTTPPPEVTVSVCRDMSCHLAGARDLFAGLSTELAEPLSAGRVKLRQVSCLGRCDAAPAACVADVAVGRTDGSTLEDRARHIAGLVHGPGAEPAPASGRRSTGSSTAGRTTRWRIDPYADEASRYGVLRGLLDQSPLAGGRQFSDAVAGPLLATLKEAGLRGMGGAGFPTQAKWEMVRARTEEPKAIIVNADESEPGTFKDRVILHELPHLVVEGAIIAARVTGARRGIIYIRHEYEPERRTLAAEIDRARASGLLPASTGGHGTPDGDAAGFDLEIFVSPGGYILGEETALLEALEDRRGEPRNKPPFPVSHGLHGKPTVINNVETLAMVPAILSRGATWWREQGRDGCSGLKFIAVSGHVARPGVYEIESGTPIRELIETAGGVPGDRPVAAIAPGGASSPFLPPSSLEVGLDFAALQKAGSMLGSGALVVVAEGTDLLDLATNVVAFFRNESCGKCVPCRTGSEKAVHILKDLLAGRGTQAAVNLLPELGETLRLTSICGLGQVALNPILSVMKHFPELVPARLGSPPPARPR